jgi:hypothetical protein
VRHPAYRIPSHVDIGDPLHDSRSQSVDESALALGHLAAVPKPPIQCDCGCVDRRYVGYSRPAAGLVVVGGIRRTPTSTFLDHQDSDRRWTAKGASPASQERPSAGIGEIDATQPRCRVQDERHLDPLADLGSLGVGLQRADLVVSHLDACRRSAGISDSGSPPVKLDMTFLINPDSRVSAGPRCGCEHGGMINCRCDDLGAYAPPA